MRQFLLACALTLATCSFAQVTDTDTIKAPTPFNNCVQPLHSDSLSSSFCIIVPKEVKPHFHANHSGQVIALSGEADMMLGDQKIHIKKGDVIFIPKGVVHSATVTSPEDALKIMSVQASYFDGSDRVMIQK